MRTSRSSNFQPAQFHRTILQSCVPPSGASKLGEVAPLSVGGYNGLETPGCESRDSGEKSLGSCGEQQSAPVGRTGCQAIACGSCGCQKETCCASRGQAAGIESEGLNYHRIRAMAEGDGSCCCCAGSQMASHCPPVAATGGCYKLTNVDRCCQHGRRRTSAVSLGEAPLPFGGGSVGAAAVCGNSVGAAPAAGAGGLPTGPLATAPLAAHLMTAHPAPMHLHHPGHVEETMESGVIENLRFAFGSAEEMWMWLRARERVRLLDVTFTDLAGGWHHCCFTAAQVSLENLRDGFGFDASSIKGFQKIDHSDYVMRVDPGSCWLDPFASFPTLHATASVFTPELEPYEKCPRQILGKAAALVRILGVADEVILGPEAEFFLFGAARYSSTPHAMSLELASDEAYWANGGGSSRGDGGSSRGDGDRNLGHRPNLKEGYMATRPADRAADIRSEILLLLEQLGIKTEKHHHEVAACQMEINIRALPVLQAADTLQVLKYIVKNCAARNNATATFMPKPLANDNGSGMHCNQSLRKANANLFYDRLYDTPLHSAPRAAPAEAATLAATVAAGGAKPAAHAQATAGGAKPAADAQATAGGAKPAADAQATAAAAGGAAATGGVTPTDPPPSAAATGGVTPTDPPPSAAAIGEVKAATGGVTPTDASKRPDHQPEQSLQKMPRLTTPVCGLSQLAMFYIGGILKHCSSLMAFACPTTNSYKRLVPHFEAPVHICYSPGNRSAAIRIPTFTDSKTKRIEFRSPDASCCPYLAFAAMICAGLDGIINKIDPGPPAVGDLFAAAEGKKSTMQCVPRTLDDALDALEQDNDYLVNHGVFTHAFIRDYITLKRKDCQEMRSNPHPHEFVLYYGC